MVNNQIIGDRDTRPSPLSPEDLAAIRDDLREQRLFREDQLRQIAAVPARTDAPVQRRSAAQTEVRVKLAASARMVLADVEAALDRIVEGRYGRCHLCRRAIDRDRLMIVPQARYCARCQQVREAGR
ncbi:TraR/DksA family transcriptional regulator [Streptomyces sp. MH60]|uniref:TraR/DksA family transcriptional regulator n=1 Tax=Streptomyces sp. MH60 TaxID=1940758 RepID=UPI000CEE5B75|nr:TraR/DksA C4-type zinc finger protein [Streptomyces sp. MH60]PPS84075.1 RNA polymerase-binding transcription factor DksA [Streptomyces sp. MH60]